MIELISGFDNAMSDNIKNQAIEYLRMIVVSWILNAISFTLAMILREKNHGSVTVFTSIITLAINITLNSIFIYNLNLGIVYLAYSTLISIFVSIIFMLLWTWIKDRTIFCNLLKIFVISSHIAKQFFKRFGSFILFAIGSIFVNIRFIFWNAGYGTGTIGESVLRISAATETIIEALHIGFLTIQCYLWNTKVSFSWAYFIFFAVEIVKLISYEIVYKNVNWTRNITHSKTID